MFSDRRTSARHQRLVQVILRIAGTPSRATTVDLSASGSFVATRQPVSIGDEVGLLFRPPGETSFTVQVTARVMRVVTPLEGMQPGMGLHFVSAYCPRGRASLESFLRRELGLTLGTHESVEPYRFGRMAAGGGSEHPPAEQPSPAREPAAPPFVEPRPFGTAEERSFDASAASVPTETHIDESTETHEAAVTHEATATHGRAKSAARPPAEAQVPADPQMPADLPSSGPGARVAPRSTSSGKIRAAQPAKDGRLPRKPSGTHLAASNTQVLGSPHFGGTRPISGLHGTLAPEIDVAAPVESPAAVDLLLGPSESHTQPARIRHPEIGISSARKAAPPPSGTFEDLKSMAEQSKAVLASVAAAQVDKPNEASKSSSSSYGSRAYGKGRRVSGGHDAPHRVSGGHDAPRRVSGGHDAPRRVSGGHDAPHRRTNLDSGGRRGLRRASGGTTGGRPVSARHKAVPAKTPSRPPSGRVAAVPTRAPEPEKPRGPLLKRLFRSTSRFFLASDEDAPVKGGEAISPTGRFYSPGTGEVPDAGDPNAISRITGSELAAISMTTPLVAMEDVPFLRPTLREMRSPVTLDVQDQFQPAEAQFVDTDTLVLVSEGAQPEVGTEMWLHLPLQIDGVWQTIYLFTVLRQDVVRVPQGWCGEFIVLTIKSHEQREAFRHFALSGAGIPAKSP
ncbi:MAG: PilZ domain-containing protein [Myxococcales bacterium]|nr:PilZ domain-containing protein [Myxococcales bacterium]